MRFLMALVETAFCAAFEAPLRFVGWLMTRPGRRFGAGCRSCRSTGTCLTCAGTGSWYADSWEADMCRSCGGSGAYPRCA